MIEVHDRKQDAELAAKLQQKAEQRYGIRASRHSHADPASRPEEFMAANVAEHGLCKLVHEDIVQPKPGAAVAASPRGPDCGWFL